MQRMIEGFHLIQSVSEQLKSSYRTYSRRNRQLKVALTGIKGEREKVNER